MALMGAEAGPAGLPFGERFTVEVLDRMPEDGHRYELIDGSLVVTPAPVWAHQAASATVFMALHAACPPELRVVHAPFEWRRDLFTSIQPDVLVARFDDLRAEGGKFLVSAPVLAVEVLSPSTRRFDRLVKLSVYEESGVGAYWLVDPDLTSPSVTVLERAGDRLVQTGVVRGDDELSVGLPFPVRFRPSDLVADLHER